MTSGFLSPSAPAWDCTRYSLFHTRPWTHLTHTMSYCVGGLLSWFFGFHPEGEFTMNTSFDPSVHLTPANLHVDSSWNPQNFRLLCLG